MTDTTEDPGPGVDVCDVLCVGETMAMVTTTDSAGLTNPVAELKLAIGGAESNVAMGLAQLGVRSAWWSRLGDDPLGRMILDTVAAGGVQTSAVYFDPSRRTGVYFKDRVPGGATKVLYYREGSAASAMSLRDIQALPPYKRILHVSGITPALSADADAFIEALLDQSCVAQHRVSFDVNFRPQLWTAAQAQGRMLALAAKADLVFVGLDEAQALWEVDTPEDVRRLFPDVRQLIVKNSGHEVTVFAGETTHRVRPPQCEVVEAVGAGDAFAAGYLAAEICGYSIPQSITIGHLTASVAIQIASDVPDLPPLETLVGQAAEHWPELWPPAHATSSKEST